MEIHVECTKNGGTGETPIRLDFDGRTVRVAELIDCWPGRGYSYFKVKGEDGATYILRHDETGAVWELMLFERQPSAL